MLLGPAVQAQTLHFHIDGEVETVTVEAFWLGERKVVNLTVDGTVATGTLTGSDVVS